MTRSTSPLSILSLGAAAMMMFAAAAVAQDDAVVATIDGQNVTEADLAIAQSDLEEQFARLPEDQRRAAALSAVIEIRLMAAAAEKAGIADTDEFTRRMALLRQRALHSAYIEQEVASKVTDEAIRARYDKEVAATPPASEVRARHIIVETQEEAAEIIASLDAGEDFEALAREHSKDGAAAQGGDLGYFGPGQMVKEFEDAAFALDVGAHTSAPVQTQFGWHVIKVEDKRVQQPPAYEAVAAQFRSLLLREAYMAAAASLREGAAVEIADPALKEALDTSDEVEQE